MRTSECYISDFDLHLIKEGKHDFMYKKLGGHLIEHQGVQGGSFAVWAPNASSVSVVGDFNHWDGRQHPLVNIDNSGIWWLFIPGLASGVLYKYEIHNSQGQLLPLKADPFGQYSQKRPANASILIAHPVFAWTDQDWLEQRFSRNATDAAMSIYEVHLGSWQRGDNNEFLTYRQLADRLIPYVLAMEFTHIQLMPVSEYPFDGSWGYQPVGLFSPTSRFGSPEDFQYFVNACHQANLGLLVDWVPGHFPSDAHGLAQFDGSHLFEHADPKQGFHPDWNTLIYNFGRHEVMNFLIASAMVWLEKYHVDGIRVDAVASMLYLDYSRNAGEWVPNHMGGRENLDAVAFIQEFNRRLYREYPGAFSVAEESTAWPGVSRPTDHGGLGFGYKWNMGWMNDTLQYMHREPIHRQYHHQEMTFGLVYSFDENFILPLSHDEVVHGKGSLLAKMPGDGWQQFANLRAYFGFMWCHPGKKLLFMGGEFGQGKEWNYEQSLDWWQLERPEHQGVQALVKQLNLLYKNTPALYQQDCQAAGFQWLDHENAHQSIYSFVRWDQQRRQPVVVLANFTSQVHHDFRLGVPCEADYVELLNSDHQMYGGSHQVNDAVLTSQPKKMHGQSQSIQITVPPLATLVFGLASLACP